jgi:hypothetical protein
MALTETMNSSQNPEQEPQEIAAPEPSSVPGPANEPAETEPAPKPPKPARSEAQLRASRENGKKSHGPATPEGKQRSSLNATRHGLLSQVIHLPAEEMAAYNEFARDYVASLSPVGAVETQLANACADLQFRLHRLSAAEHNLFAIGHEENGGIWETGHAESHSALTFAETLRRSKDPVATLTLYESRLSRRFLQTLKQLREIQAERKELEQQQLEEMYALAQLHPENANLLNPARLGFVCSDRDWKLFFKRRLLAERPSEPGSRPATPAQVRQLLMSAA